MQYLVPGYLCVCILHALTQREFSSTAKWVWSAVISFLIISLVHCIFGWINASASFWMTLSVCIILGVVFGFIIGCIYQSQWFQQKTASVLGITLIEETISNFVDWEHGSNAEIHLKGEDFYFLGHVRTVGDGEGDGRICLSAPIKYNLDGQELESDCDSPNTYVILPLEDIQYIKIIN